MTEPTVVDAAAAERLARRYPRPRVNRATKVVLVAVCTLVALGWLVWTALLHAEPAVSGDVSGFTIESDTRMQVTLTVQRRDPSRPATCRLLAQSTDFQPVAESTQTIGASPYEVVNLTVPITTLRRATSVSVRSCAST